jgi:hypothetical protein
MLVYVFTPEFQPSLAGAKFCFAKRVWLFFHVATLRLKFRSLTCWCMSSPLNFSQALQERNSALSKRFGDPQMCLVKYDWLVAVSDRWLL